MPGKPPPEPVAPPEGSATRVVVTGLGTRNALGSSVAAFSDALRAGRCGIGSITVFDTEGYRSRIAAEVPAADARPPDWLPSTLRRRVSRSDVFAIHAVAEALAESGLDPRTAPDRVGIALGGTTGGMLRAERAFRARLLGTLPRYRPGPLLASPISSTADVLARTFDIHGPRLTVSTACSSSASALGAALDWIRLGRADAVIAGGTESLCQMIFAGFNALRALSLEPCRPFDRRRSGLSLGEGAAFLVLESADSAARRGATPIAELLGWGNSADAHHLTAPHPEGRGAILAMERALAMAQVPPGAVDYVNAHGTGTPANDVVETAAIKTVFGAAARRLAVSSTKSAVGHTLGAAGAIEALTTVIALRDGFLPPTLHLEEPDPECDLDFVPERSRPAAVRCALSNSYGFGGNNTTLVFARA